MNKHSRFITSALEELSQEVGASIATHTPAVNSGDADDTTTQVNFDSATDAVAALMEKNSELVDVNAGLETDNFDNDLDAIEASADTVQTDLEDAVAAGVALEQLASIIDVAVKTNQVNPTSVAGFAMALEQISYRGGLSNPIPALEAEANIHLGEPVVQAEIIANTAMSKAKDLSRRLIEGIQRIIGWLLNMLRNFFSTAKSIGERAKKAQALVNSIDDSKTIDSTAFIASLRLVEGGGDPNKQFEEYATLASKTLYGFFNVSFAKELRDAINFGRTENDEGANARAGATARISEILKALLGTVYTESGTGADVSAHLPNDVDESALTVGKTPLCLGGVQLYLAATLEANDIKSGKPLYCQSGIVKTAPKIETPESIPVANKGNAKRMLGTIEGWMRDHKELEETFNVIRGMNFVGQVSLDMPTIKMYMSVLTALASGCVPHLLRLNMKNATSYIAYVEKSAAVSQGAPAEKA